ncbi:Leucine-rich repeat-containing N-terminal, plant-type [Dillenia turbinata]|uniref:non-specific serine/threonine protein kinase n=1 Tax=Dillenia turbinata TaxID=194707 RepID=A0AAN8VVV1_9MAGN
MAKRHGSFTLVSAIFFTIMVSSSSASDSKALLQFKESLENVTALSDWNSSVSPCTDQKANWKGVICWNGHVWGLKLENMGLSGSIDVDSLASLGYLRTLSFMNNSFEGSLPNVKQLSGLKSLYLSNNKLSGDIASDAFAGMDYLKKLHLANNKFTGKIPESLAHLQRLLELRVEGNQFDSVIPEFHVHLNHANFSNNKLEGKIPASLAHLSKDSFSGNEDLCGAPLQDCNTSKKPSKLMIVIIVIVVAAALAAICAVLIILHRRRKTSLLNTGSTSDLQKGAAAARDLDEVERGSTAGSDCSRKSEPGMLSFVRDDHDRFDLQDLLKASAEILGSGCFGSSYKASLVNGQMVVVKRFKQMNNFGREEFHEHMRRLGRLKHRNVLPLVAYYFRKEEKLFVTDFVKNGSLAGHLHGKHNEGHPSLDWPTRLKIVKGVTRGLAYLYAELPSLIVPHGHLKSSNVLLNESFEPLLTDYGLVPAVNLEHAQEYMVAYKAPEYTQQNRITKKTDVWSLGMLILEILTGKFQASFLQQAKESEQDLASWVNSMEQQEWMSKVIDHEMNDTKNAEGEIMKLLEIGLACTEGDAEKRYDMKEAAEKIEELKERDTDDDFYSSHASDGDARSSRGLSDDISISWNV